MRDWIRPLGLLGLLGVAFEGNAVKVHVVHKACVASQVIGFQKGFRHVCIEIYTVLKCT